MSHFVQSMTFQDSLASATVSFWVRIPGYVPGSPGLVRTGVSSLEREWRLRRGSSLDSENWGNIPTSVLPRVKRTEFRCPFDDRFAEKMIATKNPNIWCYLVLKAGPILTLQLWEQLIEGISTEKLILHNLYQEFVKNSVYSWRKKFLFCKWFPCANEITRLARMLTLQILK